jgi:hypothetical protein
MYDNRKLVLDGTLNVVTEMPTIDANSAVLNFPSRYSIVTYLQSNVPAGQGAIQGGPAGDLHVGRLGAALQ